MPSKTKILAKHKVDSCEHLHEYIHPSIHPSIPDGGEMYRTKHPFKWIQRKGYTPHFIQAILYIDKPNLWRNIMIEYRKMDADSIKKRKKMIAWYVWETLRVFENGNIRIEAVSGAGVGLSWEDGLIYAGFDGRDVEEAFLKLILYTEYERCGDETETSEEEYDRIKSMEKMFCENYAVDPGFIDALQEEFA